MALEAQNNPFTSILLVEAGDVEALPDADPSAGQRRLAVGPDHLLYLVDDAGVKTLVGAGFSGDAGDIPFTPAAGIAATDVQAAIQEAVTDAAALYQPLLTVSENRLTADVAVTPTTTYVDGPSLSLAAGTYIIDGHVEVTISAAGWITCKLMEGSTPRDAVEGFQTTATAGLSFSVHAKITIASTTTVKIQVAVSTPTTGNIRATPAINNTGLTNLGSYLRAIKIG